MENPLFKMDDKSLILKKYHLREGWNIKLMKDIESGETIGS